MEDAKRIIRNEKQSYTLLDISPQKVRTKQIAPNCVVAGWWLGQELRFKRATEKGDEHALFKWLNREFAKFQTDYPIEDLEESVLAKRDKLFGARAQSEDVERERETLPFAQQPTTTRAGFGADATVTVKGKVRATQADLEEKSEGASDATAASLLSMTPAEIELLQQALHQHYQIHAQINYLFYTASPMPIEYVPRLAMVGNERYQTYETTLLSRSSSKSQLEEKTTKLTLPMTKGNIDRQQSYEDLYQLNLDSLIGFEDIFSESFKKRIFLGRAGIGKTTTCKWIVAMWQKSSKGTDSTNLVWLTKKFSWLFWVPLRELENYYQRHKKHAAYSIPHFIYEHFFLHDDRITFKMVRRLLTHLKNNYNNPFYLLDGYDEIYQLHEPNTQIGKLLDAFLQEPFVILTSRPYAFQQKQKFLLPMFYQYNNSDVTLEILGFTDKDIEIYIKNYFEYSMVRQVPTAILSKAQTLINTLSEDAALWNVCRTPIMLEIICSIWNDESATDTSLFATMTITTLYQTIIYKLSKLFNEKTNYQYITQASIGYISEKNLEEKLKGPLCFLETLAFTGLTLNKSIRLDSSLVNDLNKHKPIEERVAELKALEQSHFIRPIGRHTHPADQDYYFIHLSIQEFFAARHVVRMFSSNDPMMRRKANDFIKQEKYNTYYENIFRFASGLIHNEKMMTDERHEGLQQEFWDLLYCPPIDLTGLTLLRSATINLEETEVDEKISQCSILVAAANENLEVLKRSLKLNFTTPIYNLFNLKFEHAYLSEWIDAVAYCPHLLKILSVLKELPDEFNIVDDEGKVRCYLMLKQFKAFSQHQPEEYYLLKLLKSRTTAIRVAALYRIMQLGIHLNREMLNYLMGWLDESGFIVNQIVLQFFKTLPAEYIGSTRFRVEFSKSGDSRRESF